MSRRLAIVNEVKLKCIELELTDDPATKILFRMLDNYHKKGTVYNNELIIRGGRYDIPRKYVIDLYNDVNKKDTVVIKTL